jgi:hypothetical protein
VSSRECRSDAGRLSLETVESIPYGIITIGSFMQYCIVPPIAGPGHSANQILPAANGRVQWSHALVHQPWYGICFDMPAGC